MVKPVSTSLTAPDDKDNGIAAYRLTSLPEVAALLRKLYTDRVRLNLSSEHGDSYTTILWGLDVERDFLSFAADPHDPQLQALLEAKEVVVLGYVDNIKVQFDASNLVLVHGATESALNAAYPREVFRFQRRDNFRTRPLLQSAPVARMRHPVIPDMELTLRILDVSITGCAILLPNDVPPLQPGIIVNQVQIQLNHETHFSSALSLHHVTLTNADSRGTRLGCEMLLLNAEAKHALQRYINQTQKLRRLMSVH